MTNAPPPAPSSTPTPRERLDTLLKTVNELQIISEEEKRNFQTTIRTLQDQERQNQLDQERLRTIERQIQEIQGISSAPRPQEQQNTTNEFGDILGGLDGLGFQTGAQGQQLSQALGQMGKIKTVIYKIAKMLMGVPLLGAAFKNMLPEPLQQEIERLQSGDKVIKAMKRLLPGQVAPDSAQGNTELWVRELKAIYDPLPQPKPSTFEAWYEEKITRLRARFQPPYQLEHLWRLARYEHRPGAAERQREQTQQNTESLEHNQKRAYAIALVNAFNAAANATIITPTLINGESSIDFAERMGGLLEYALDESGGARFDIPGCYLELSPDGLQATDTWNSWYTFGIADYTFPDTGGLGQLLREGKLKEAFDMIKGLNISPLDKTSKTAMQRLQSSLRQSERTIPRDLRAAPSQPNRPPAAPSRPPQTQTASAQPQAGAPQAGNPQ